MGIPVYRNPKAIQSIKIADTMDAKANELERECPYLTDVASGLRMQACEFRNYADDIEGNSRRKPSVTERINSKILEAKKSLRLISTKNISDSHHTFRELCTCLLALICNSSYKEISWKSKHFDNENDPMFEGDFIIGIETPEGTACFHIPLKYLF